MAALSDEVKNRVRLALGYGLVLHGAYFEMDGMSQVVDYTNRLEYMMDNVVSGADSIILSVLSNIEKIEETMSHDALCRLKIESTDKVTMNQNELSELERQYVRWVMKLCDILSCNPFPRSNLFRMLQQYTGGSSRRSV